MCGVAGALTRDPQLGDLVAPMLQCLQHRGPDGTHSTFMDRKGLVADPNTQYWRACLGHTRLSLVGSGANGRQPSSTPTGMVLSAVNGEIYNHHELRADLAQRGTLGVNDSDCDVVPNLYEQYGLAGLANMEGVYSGALVDLRTMTLVLFKDRFGSRPIYYIHNSQGIFFASEIKALLTLPSVGADLNHQAAVEYFAFQTPLQRHTLFAGINTLRPGEALLYANGQLRIRDIMYPRRSYAHLSFPEAVVHTRQALETAIGRQWRPGAGAYLSGGVDSNAIVATLALQGKRPRTYTAAFSAESLDAYDAGGDESKCASHLASSYGVRHHKTRLSPKGLIKALPSIVWHLEDLRMPMSFGAWDISRQASAHNPVLFSGMGGDELFGGYVRRIAALASAGASEASWLSAYSDMWGSRALTVDERERALRSLGTKTELRSGPYEALREQFSWARSRYRHGPIGRLLALEQSFYLPGLLIVDDRMSMAHGVETRVPLIDYRLADIAETVPESFLVREGMGKLLLRQAILDRVPRSIVFRPKQPFRVPEATWYRKDLASWVAESLLSKQSRLREFFASDFLDEVLYTHFSGVRNRRHLIWSLLSFEYWCRIFLAPEIGRPNGNAAWMP